MPDFDKILSDDQLIHPRSEYRDSVIELINDVDGAPFDFEAELGEVREMHVELVPEPELSVEDFNKLYADAQGYRSRVASIIMEVVLIKAEWTSRLSKARWLYETGTNYIYSTDEEPYNKIKSAKNLAIQGSYIAECMPHLYDIRDKIDRICKRVDAILSIFKEKKDDLDEILTNLSRQQRNVETMVGLGAIVIVKGNKSNNN